MKKMLTIFEVADALNVSVLTVRREIKRGNIEAFRVGGQIRFTENSLLTYLKRNVVEVGESA